MLVCRKWMGWIKASAVYGGSCFYDRDNKPDASVMQRVSGFILGRKGTDRQSGAGRGQVKQEFGLSRTLMMRKRGSDERHN